eukprot:37393-Eustigmatos_ZCMA.PRE.1
MRGVGMRRLWVRANCLHVLRNCIPVRTEVGLPTCSPLRSSRYGWTYRTSFQGPRVDELSRTATWATRRDR